MILLQDECLAHKGSFTVAKFLLLNLILLLVSESINLPVNISPNETSDTRSFLINLQMSTSSTNTSISTSSLSSSVTSNTSIFKTLQRNTTLSTTSSTSTVKTITNMKTVSTQPFIPLAIPNNCGSSFLLPVLVEKATEDVFVDIDHLSRVISIAISDTTAAIFNPTERIFTPRYITLDLNNSSEIQRVAKEVLQLIQCPVPVLSLVIPKVPGFQQLLTVLDFFKIPVITPFPLPTYDDHIQSERLVSFSAPKSSQSAALLDFMRLVGWTRAALIYSLHPESSAFSLALQPEALARGLVIELVKPLPVFSFEGTQIKAAAASTLKADAIGNLAHELSHFYTKLDFTVFIIGVEAEAISYVIPAIQQAGLQGLQGVVFLATDILAQVFRSSTALLFGVAEDDDFIGESSWWLEEQRLGSGLDSSVLEGWIFTSPSYRADWEPKNSFMQHKLNRNHPFRRLQEAERQFEPHTKLVPNIALPVQNQSHVELSYRPSVGNTSIPSVPLPRMADIHIGLNQKPRITGHYELLVYDIVRAIWDVLVDVYNLHSARNDCTILPNVSTVEHQYKPSTVCHSGFSISADTIDLIKRFRSTKPRIFKSIGSPIMINSFGTVTPRFTLFNIRNVPSIHGRREFSPVPVGRWHALSEGLRPSAFNPLAETLTVVAGRLHSLVAKSGAKATLPGYAAVLLQSPERFAVLHPGDLQTTSSHLHSHYDNGSQINSIVNLPDLAIVEFPGSPHRIPKDCLFCRKGASSAPPSVACLICEEDRDEILHIYKHIQSYNPLAFVGLNGSSLSPNLEPDTTPLCELWPGVLRCNSPWSYVLDLEGLELEGPLPSHLGYLRHVQELHFYRNLFNGSIPSFLPSLCPEPRLDSSWKRSEESGNAKVVEGWPPTRLHASKLKAIYFGKNQLEGTIPDDVGYCEHLQILNIKNNRIKGRLPNSICYLSDLIELDFSGNVLNGTIPKCIGGIQKGSIDNDHDHDTLFQQLEELPQGLTNLQYINGENNRISGSLPEGLRHLSRLVLFSFKSNSLQGHVPDVWTSHPSNLLVDLSQNSGLLPPLPSSLARRLKEDATKVIVDPQLFGCSKGYRAPNIEDWEKMSESTRRIAKESLELFCRPCPRGSIPSPDSAVCKKCPAGSVAPKVASFLCEKCPAGTFSNKGNDKCSLCQPGSYSYIAGSLTCHPCPSNHFSEDSGSVLCLPCPAGANCSTPEQQRRPHSLPGWFRIELVFESLGLRRATGNINFSLGSKNRQISDMTHFLAAPQHLIVDGTLHHRVVDPLIVSPGRTPEGGIQGLLAQPLNEALSTIRRLAGQLQGVSWLKPIIRRLSALEPGRELSHDVPNGIDDPRRLTPTNEKQLSLVVNGASDDGLIIPISENRHLQNELISEKDEERLNLLSWRLTSPTSQKNDASSSSILPGNLQEKKNLTAGSGSLPSEENKIDTSLFHETATPIQRFVVYECPVSSRCLGNNICSKNSYGPFCHRCLPNYTTTLWSTECTQCRPLSLVLIRLVSVTLILFLVGFLVFKSFRRAGKEPRKKKVGALLRSDSFCRKNSLAFVNSELPLHEYASKREHHRKTQAVILKVFTNWLELTAQALVMAVQAALVNEGQQGTVISDRLEGIYNFIQNLDDPFFLLLPLDCLSPYLATPVHIGLVMGLLSPIVILIITFVFQFWKQVRRKSYLTYKKNFQKHSAEQIVMVHSSKTPMQAVFLNVDSSNEGGVTSPITLYHSTSEINSRGCSRRPTTRPPSNGRVVSECYDGKSIPCSHGSHSSRDSVTTEPRIKNNTVFKQQKETLQISRITYIKHLIQVSWPSTVGVFIPIFFLMHPAITRQFLNNLECDKYDESRLARDVLLTCGRGSHVHFLYLAWIGLLAWTFGLPLLFGWMMRSHRHELYNPKVLLQWGFLLDGYEHRYYWWEVWAMLRKVLVDVPPVVPFLDDNLQLVALLTVAVVSLAAHAAAEPFDNRCFKIADRLESLVLWSFLLTLLTIPIHQTLTSSNSDIANIFSKVLLSFTITVSASFVVWAALFYARPLIRKFDEWDTTARSERVADVSSDNSSSLSTKLNDRDTSLLEITVKHSSNDAEYSIGSTRNPSSPNGPIPYESCVTKTKNPEAISSTASTSMTSCNGRRHRLPFLSSIIRVICIGWRNSSKALHKFVISPMSCHIRCCLRRLFLSEASRRILHLEPKRIWISTDGVLDMSELRKTDRRFLRQLILEDMLDALFTPNTTKLDTALLSITLLAIFRRRAFQIEVKATRERLKRLPNIRTTRHRWANPILLSSRMKLQPLLSAVKNLKDSSLQRLQSVGGALRLTGPSSQGSEVPSTHRLGSRLFGTQRLGSTTGLSDSQSSSVQSVFSRTFGSIEVQRYARNQTEPIESVSTGPTSLPNRGCHIQKYHPWDHSQASGTTDTVNPVAIEEMEVSVIELEVGWGRTEKEMMQPAVSESYEFIESTTQRSDEALEVTKHFSEVAQRITPEREGLRSDFVIRNHFSQKVDLLDRWRRTVLIIRFSLAFIRGLRDFRNDLLIAATQIGLTVEDLQTEVSKFNLYKKLSIEREKELELQDLQ